MKRAAKKNTLLHQFARKVGHAAGRVVATTQELAESAAAMVGRNDPPAISSAATARTPRKHSTRRAPKKAGSLTPISRSRRKKSNSAPKSPKAKAAPQKSRSRHAASRS
jgi:hypothetical protein